MGCTPRSCHTAALYRIACWITALASLPYWHPQRKFSYSHGKTRKAQAWAMPMKLTSPKGKTQGWEHRKPHWRISIYLVSSNFPTYVLKGKWGGGKKRDTLKMENDTPLNIKSNSVFSLCPDHLFQGRHSTPSCLWMLLGVCNLRPEPLRSQAEAPQELTRGIYLQVKEAGSRASAVRGDALSLAAFWAITPEHPAIPKSINNFSAAQGTLPHLIKVSSCSYGFISP